MLIRTNPALGWTSLVIAVMLGVGGVLVHDIVYLSPMGMEIRNSLGMMTHRVPFGSRRDLVVRDGALFVRTERGEVGTGVGGWWTRQDDLAAVAEWAGACPPADTSARRQARLPVLGLDVGASR